MASLEQNVLAQAPVLTSAARIDGGCDIEERRPLATLLYVQHGRGETTIDQVAYPVAEGDLIALRPSSICRIATTSEQPLKAIRLTYAVQVKDRDPGEILARHQSPVITLSKNYQLTSSYFETICKESEFPSLGGADLTSSLLQAVTIMLLRSQEIAAPPDEISMSQQIKAYIKDNYERDLTLSDLAQLVHVSPYHLAHVFKTELGMAPIQYLIQCRIEEAKRLLVQTKLSINEISVMVGYPNPNYFNQIFKKMTGTSPGKYRK